MLIEFVSEKKLLSDLIKLNVKLIITIYFASVHITILGYLNKNTQKKLKEKFRSICFISIS